MEYFMQTYSNNSQLLEESDINQSAIYEAVTDLY